MSSEALDDDVRRRIMHGGPLYGMLEAIGLRGGVKRAFVLMGLCWVVPVLLLWQGPDPRGVKPFVEDWGAWSKFLVAPVLLTLAEKPIGFALDQCTSLVFRIPVVASQSMQDARKAC